MAGSNYGSNFQAQSAKPVTMRCLSVSKLWSTASKRQDVRHSSPSAKEIQENLRKLRFSEIYYRKNSNLRLQIVRRRNILWLQKSKHTKYRIKSGYQKKTDLQFFYTHYITVEPIEEQPRTKGAMSSSGVFSSKESDASRTKYISRSSLLAKLW